MPAVLDTHAAIWYLLDTKNLSETVFSLIDGAAASGVPTYISAVSLVEVVYLVERGRIAADAFERICPRTRPGQSRIQSFSARLQCRQRLEVHSPRRCSRHARPHHRRNCPPPWPSARHPRPPPPSRWNPNNLVVIIQRETRCPSRTSYLPQLGLPTASGS